MTSTPSCSRSWALACSLAALGCTANTQADTDGPETFGSGMGTDSGTDSATTSETSDPSTDGSTGTTDAEVTTNGNTTNGNTTNAPPCDAPLMSCGVQCVDTRADVTNCGGCGISCVIPNGEAGCEGGSCTVVGCDDGWSDCDGDPANGCEAQSNCQEGADCTTECGSTGTTTCDAMCQPVCATLAESCNAVDDDCNGQCDEGPLMDCRIGVHRSNGGAQGHFYTTDLNEAMSGGYSLEFQDFYFLYTAQAGGLQPFFRCQKPNTLYFYTTSTDCEGLGAPQVTVGFISPAETCGSTPLYRVFSSSAGNHFYTTSAAERDNAVANLGYADEGIAGHVWQGP